MAKFPEFEEFITSVGEKVLDEVQYRGFTIREWIEKITSGEYQPVKNGRWIPTEYDGYADGAPVWDKWECSECGYEHSGEEDTLTSFCPNCGAKMDGGAD
jgi:rubrerythrin